jgi:HEAT repeat protein
MVEKPAEKPAAKNDALTPLIADLLGEHDGRRNAAVLQLMRDAPKAVAAVTPALKHNKKPIRIAAALILSRAGKSGLPAFVSAYQHKDAAVRLTAIQGLSLQPTAKNEKADPRVATLLNSALKDPALAVRVAATANLLRGQSNPTKETLAPLFEALKGKDSSLRLTAITLLASLGPSAKEAMKWLGGTATDKHPLVRFSGIAAMANINPSIGGLMREGLRKALKSPDAVKRGSAALAMAMLAKRDKADDDALKAALADKDEVVRHSAKLALSGALRRRPQTQKAPQKTPPSNH